MTNSLSATLLELLRNLFGSAEEQAKFLNDPEDYLADNGYGDLTCADFDDALLAFVDTDATGGDYNLGGSFSNTQTVRHDGQDDAGAISERLTQIIHEYGDTYITNNTDDRDVVNDSSFKGTLIADDVTFDNDIINASGDGAVAAGDDINGDVVTGDDNILGNGNVDGDINATDSGINFGAGGVARGGDDQDNDTVVTQDNDTTTTTTTTAIQDNDTLVVQDNDTTTDVDVEISDDDTETGPGNLINT